MSRPLRILATGAIYHVMNRSTARQTTTFLDEDDYQAFLNPTGQLNNSSKP